MASFFDNFSVNAIQEETEAINKNFFAQGERHGWPEGVMKQVSVFTDETGVHLSYDENLEQQISTLEYGGLGQPAKAAIRNFTADLDRMIANILAKRGAEAMFARGILP